MSNDDLAGLKDRLEAVERERDTLAERLEEAKDWEGLVYQYQAERDALSAHVVRLMGALELARDRIALLAEIATERGASVYAALDMWPEEMAQTLAEAPTTTSLARRDLLKQAEVLEEMSGQFGFHERARMVLIWEAQALRRKAKGGE